MNPDCPSLGHVLTLDWDCSSGSGGDGKMAIPLRYFKLSGREKNMEEDRRLEWEPYRDHPLL